MIQPRRRHQASNHIKFLCFDENAKRTDVMRRRTLRAGATKILRKRVHSAGVSGESGSGVAGQVEQGLCRFWGAALIITSFSNETED